MPSKQQIMPVQVAAACETYNCHKKAAWAIGRPDGPRQLWHYHCDQCMLDVVESAPEELRPVEPPIDPEKLVEAFGQLCGASAMSKGTSLKEEVFAMLNLPTEPEIKSGIALSIFNEIKNHESAKTYTCGYCGESFPTPQGKASHSRYCKARKEAKPDES